MDACTEQEEKDKLKEMNIHLTDGVFRLCKHLVESIPAEDEKDICKNIVKIITHKMKDLNMVSYTMHERGKTHDEANSKKMKDKLDGINLWEIVFVR